MTAATGRSVLGINGDTSWQPGYAVSLSQPSSNVRWFGGAAQDFSVTLSQPSGSSTVSWFDGAGQGFSVVLSDVSGYALTVPMVDGPRHKDYGSAITSVNKRQLLFNFRAHSGYLGAI